MWLSSVIPGLSSGFPIKNTKFFSFSDCIQACFCHVCLLETWARRWNDFLLTGWRAWVSMPGSWLSSSKHTGIYPFYSKAVTGDHFEVTAWASDYDNLNPLFWLDAKLFHVKISPIKDFSELTECIWGQDLNICMLLIPPRSILHVCTVNTWEDDLGSRLPQN
jgi:hypothetical protein